MKPQRILDLPNELLIHIFEYVEEGRTSIDEPWVFDVVPYNIKIIQDLRLTCRRFHATSSHLLLPFVKVNITHRSLTRLDEISHHPFISRGVRAIKLCLGPFYDSVITHDIQAFAAYQASKLRPYIPIWDTFVGREIYGSTSTKTYQKASTKAVALAESWEKLAAQGVDTNCAEHLLILKAHAEYLQLYEDYEALSGSVVQIIASAMVRLPTATWIKVDDNHSSWSTGYLRPEDLDQENSLLDHLLLPMGWSDTKKYMLGPPPFHLIGELLFSIERLGIPLKGLDIETPPPTGLFPTSDMATTHDLGVLRTTFKQLETISFCPQTNFWDQHWTKRAPEEWIDFIDFLLHLLHTRSLRKIHLNFDFMCNYDPPPQLSMARLLLSYIWPNLQDLYFNGPFHLKELKAIVKPLRRTVKLQWCGYLMSGSWADVLDLLRERNAPCQQLGDGNADGGVHGQECDRMNDSVRQSIFRQNHFLESKATQYIREELPSNPVRDWEMGDLNAPEPVSM
ncbi:hypothetical protein EV127DRAFT_443940 [Xylaria flabelliformis]|nr:hypothetical protein EV127DRAFT_443940 [Xylaria flabelliformis]